MLLMNDGVKRVAFGYTRISTEEQTFGASLKNQRIAIQNMQTKIISKLSAGIPTPVSPQRPHTAQNSKRCWQISPNAKGA